MGEQPSCQDHLLLIATGKGFDRRIRRSSLNAQKFNIFFCKLVGFCFRKRFEKSFQYLLCQYNVVTDRKITNDTVYLTVFWQIADSVSHGIDGPGNFDRLAVLFHGSACYFVRSQYGTDTFASS